MDRAHAHEYKARPKPGTLRAITAPRGAGTIGHQGRPGMGLKTMAAAPTTGNGGDGRARRAEYSVTEMESILLELLKADRDPPVNFLEVCRKRGVQSNQLHAWLGKALLYRRPSIMKAIKDYWARRPGAIDYDAPEPKQVSQRDIAKVEQVLRDLGATLPPGTLANLIGHPITTTPAPKHRKGKG